MTIYSRWRPDGGYDYYEADGGFAIGDDLPIARLGVVNDIGVPSLEAGRMPPGTARYVGGGDVARGLISPIDEKAARELGQSGSFGMSQPVLLATVFSLGAASAWLYMRWRRRRA